MVGWGPTHLPLLTCALLLLLWRSNGLVGRGRHWAPKEDQAHAIGKEMQLGHDETMKRRLGTMHALSRQYWQYLACGLWQAGCEGEEDEQADMDQKGWSLPLEVLSSWYCSFSKCCETGDCRVTNNITGLESDLNRRLHGQHLARKLILRAVRGFLQRPQPEKALVLSFHGWSGTGKNFVARMIADHLYRDGLKSECVKVFISLFHFPHPAYLDSYKVQLKKQISETVNFCEQALFIFDEAEKLHTDLLDTIKPYVDHYDSIGQVDYRRSIFLFLSNSGGNTINEVALDFWRAGQAREEITMEYLEQRLRMELKESPGTAFAHSHLLEENLIDFFVPFLPLEFHHVKLCARDAFLAQGLPYTETALDEVARMMVFVPKDERLFSAQGCKSVSQRINYILP
ncbi:PREDICTED: torsin-3A isoform X1 [Gavialis gangeticus]|uniref:torsin-3A isoform X1 n=1 Tax=Gavialis gangeticus TaxID=94835 RepID=UPI00092F2E93|nr:PREDICTED: torsin-3A isoform X1 [Gavialis gangeticus]